MEGVISNYRGSRRTQKTSEMVVKIAGTVDKVEADKLKGKVVVWKSPAGKEIKGIVKKAHGNSGAVLTKFEKGLPGQSIGTKVEIN
ncbi:MAG: 50S ribosomal protein L35ae [Nanoarchaeota archaeon]|nr:50S ribosomal protein L35ae [Nanoarchaeota archaeon]MBU1444724.1 50S ribosomal protein L35ae [Nanoarchaeota archaeon]MBU2420780.1 50S ribosomal protein L35ae [Nanoarchaeota archaeon]MBU2475377.1 50S ribosomal protein L35ae [Nanoarchaeota archaeon]